MNKRHYSLQFRASLVVTVSSLLIMIEDKPLRDGQYICGCKKGVLVVLYVRVRIPITAQSRACAHSGARDFISQSPVSITVFVFYIRMCQRSFARRRACGRGYYYTTCEYRSICRIPRNVHGNSCLNLHSRL